MTNVVDDIEHMIEIISNLSAFQDLSTAVPNIKELMDWSLEVLNFTRFTIDGLPLSPEK